MWSLVPGFPLRRDLMLMSCREQTDLHRQTQNREMTRAEIENLTDDEAAQRWSEHVVAGLLTKKERKGLTDNERQLRQDASDVGFRESVLQVRLLIASTPEVPIAPGVLSTASFSLL